MRDQLVKCNSFLKNLQETRIRQWHVSEDLFANCPLSFLLNCQFGDLIGRLCRPWPRLMTNCWCWWWSGLRTEESGWEREEAPSSFHHYFVSIMFSNADKKLTAGSQSRLQHVRWDYKLPLPGQWSGNFRLIWWDIIIIINGMVNRRQSWEIPFVSPALVISVWYMVSGDTIHTHISIGWQLKCQLLEGDKCLSNILFRG